MQHHHAPPDPSEEEHSGDALPPLQAQLEGAIAKRFWVRASGIRPDRGDPPREHRVSSGERVRQGGDLLLDRLAAVLLDRAVHQRMITYMLFYKRDATRRCVVAVSGVDCAGKPAPARPEMAQRERPEST